MVARMSVLSLSPISLSNLSPHIPLVLLSDPVPVTPPRSDMGPGSGAMAATAALVTLAVGPPPPKGSWCPRFHVISGHYDPSGPLQHEGRWHVFPDGGNHSKWSHYASTDLLRWTKQSEASPATMVGGHDTGSVSVTEAGVIALYPGANDIVRQQRGAAAAPGGGGGGVDWTWGATGKQPSATRPAALGKGFRDPSRALKMPDGNYYVAVGSGFGGTGPNSNNNTGLPDSGTGCMAWMRATDPTLSNLSFVCCLLENNRTTGHIDPTTIAWNSTDLTAAFIECPDVFPLGGGEKYVAIASLYNWKHGGYYTNEWFLGTIADSKTFVLEDRGLLDFGQCYAARTGSASQLRTDRRVLFGATGWHNPQGFDGTCKGQYHLIPRDVALDPEGRVTFSPLPEIATLHTPGSRTTMALAGSRGDSGGPLATAANGSMLELQLNCTGTPAAGGGVVGVNVLANDGMGSFTTVGYNYSSGRLFVDQSKTCCAGNDSGDRSEAAAAAKPGLLQTAPLLNSTAGEGIQLYVLLDYALIEAFANRRAVISSWVGQIMWHDAPPPDERRTFVLPAPAGVACTFQSWELQPLLPPNPGPQ